MCAETTPTIRNVSDNLNFTPTEPIEFLQDYYSRADKDTYFVLAHLDKEGHFVQRFFKVEELYKDPSEVKEFIEVNIDKNLYYSINTFKTAKRNAREVANILALAFDFDLHRPITDVELKKIMEVIANFESVTGLRATVIKSGGGVQVFILPDKSLYLVNFVPEEKLDELYRKYGPELSGADDELFQIANDNMKKALEALGKRFAEELAARRLTIEVDSAVYDFARVMRLPYTYNVKYSEPIQTELIKYNVNDYDNIRKMIEYILNNIENIQEEDNEVLLTELDSDTIKQLAIDLQNELGEFYIRGRRHFIALSLAGFMHKYTTITESDARKIIEIFAQLMNDEEVKDRVKAVETTYTKKLSDVSAFSILATIMRPEELEKFREAVRNIFEKYAVARLDTRVYALIERTLNTKKFVTMSNRGIELVTIRYEEEQKYRVKTQVIAYAQLEINRIVRLVKNGNTMTLYDMSVIDTISRQKIELKEKTVEEFARSLRDLALSVVSTEKLTNYLTAILKRLEELRDIKIVYVYHSFDIDYEPGRGYTIIPPDRLKRVIDAGADLDSIDMNHIYEILNNIKDREKLLVLLAGMVTSAFSKTDNLLRPIVLLEGERGTGKTTLARFFTSVAFLNDEGSNDTLLSEFRTIELLTQSYTPVLIDDAEMQRPEVQKLLKSYSTGTYIVKRGRSNLKVEEYELKNTIVITSNNFYTSDDALKSRIIVLKTDEKTFKTEWAAFETENPELRGWGYILLERVVNWLNERGKRFSELVFEEYKTIDLDDRRRARIYAQLFAALRVLVEVIEDEELSERLARVYENKAGIIKLIEAEQTTSAESMMLDTILTIIERDEEVQKFVITDFRGSEEEKFITGAALAVIKKKYSINITMKRLADMLDTRITTRRIGGKVTKVVKITKTKNLSKYLS